MNKTSAKVATVNKCRKEVNRVAPEDMLFEIAFNPDFEVNNIISVKLVWHFLFINLFLVYEENQNS